MQVPGLTGVIAIAGGLDHTLALKADGTVWAWGDNAFGQLGDGTTIGPRHARCRYRPHRRDRHRRGRLPLAGAEERRHRLGLGRQLPTASWATGRSPTAPRPVQVRGLTGVTAIAAGDGHSLALQGDGTVWAWGFNGNGELGDGTTTNRHTPVPGQRPGPA